MTEQYILDISGGLSCKFKQWENQWVPLLIHEKGCHCEKKSKEMWLFRSHSSRGKQKRREQGQHPLNLSINGCEADGGLPEIKPLEKKIDSLFPPLLVIMGCRLFE